MTVVGGRVRRALVDGLIDIDENSKLKRKKHAL